MESVWDLGKDVGKFLEMWKVSGIWDRIDYRKILEMWKVHGFWERM